MGGYGVRLAAVNLHGVERFCASGEPLSCSLVFQCSPLVAKWVELEPLGSLLARAVEGGNPLREGLWNPVRAPRSHSPEDVRLLARDLGRAWLEAEQTPIACDDFFIGEIKRVVELFVHASVQDEAVVSVVLPVREGPDGAEVRIFADH
jgi:hypothetical protein